MPSVVSIGDACIDEYLEPIGERYIGGNAVNVAVHLARLDVEASFIGAIGTDQLGDYLIQTLKKEGVEVSEVERKEGLTAITKVTLEDGERVFSGERLGVIDRLTLDEKKYKFIASYDHVHHSGFTSWGSLSPPHNKTMRAKIVRHLQKLDRMNLTISFDFSHLVENNFLNTVSNLINVGFFSQPQLSRVESEQFADSRFKDGIDTVIVTRGSRGSLAFDGESFYYQDSEEVSVVDTLGAGDAYIAGFLATKLSSEENGNMSECLSKATNMAVATCKKLGAL